MQFFSLSPSPFSISPPYLLSLNNSPCNCALRVYLCSIKSISSSIRGLICHLQTLWSDPRLRYSRQRAARPRGTFFPPPLCVCGSCIISSLSGCEVCAFLCHLSCYMYFLGTTIVGYSEGCVETMFPSPCVFTTGSSVGSRSRGSASPP